MAIRVVTQPAIEPVTLSEAKLQCRIDPDLTVDDALLTRQIKAARRWAEAYLQRPIVSQTRELTLDAFPTCGIILRDAPIISIESIAYADADGAVQPLVGFQQDLYSDPARLMPAYGQAWPVTRDVLNAVAVRYVAGYGAADAVPEEIKCAVLLVVADLYEHREDSIDGVPISEVPTSAASLLNLVRSYSA